LSGFLEQLGAKIADQWFSSFLLPGLLWVCCLTLGYRLGWPHAFDPHMVDSFTRRLADQHSAVDTFLLIAGVLVASAGIGLTASGVAVMIRMAWTMPGHVGPARWLREARQRRWDQADTAVTSMRLAALRAGPGVTAGPGVAVAVARRNATGLERPERPTWIGDRWRATFVRVFRAYGLDLTIVWSRLWVLLPDTLRDDIATAQSAYRSATIVVAWGVLYGAIGLYWGPALLIAIVLALVGRTQARDGTGVLCDLVETACDLYGDALASQLHIPCQGAVTPDEGRRINAILRKESP
jgi:hypothetical protein